MGISFWSCGTFVDFVSSRLTYSFTGPVRQYKISHLFMLLAIKDGSSVFSDTLTTFIFIIHRFLLEGITKLCQF